MAEGDWGPGGEVRTVAPAVTPSLAGDWGPGGEHRGAVVRVEPSPEQRAWPNLPGQATPGTEQAPEGETLTSLSEDQVQSVDTVGKAMLIEYGCPDPVGFEAELAKLSMGVCDHIGRAVFLCGHPLDVALKAEGKYTLEQTVEAKEWWAQLPPPFKAWLRSLGDKR